MKVKGVVTGLGAAGGVNDGLLKRPGVRNSEAASMKLVRDIDVSSYKVVRSAADLAINGAPPMFAEPIHVGRPNIGNHKRFLQRASDILDSGWLSNNGPIAQEFEQRIAAFLGVRHCVAMCNGTIALEIATRALELKGEVIVPSYTFIATAHALQWQEITPIFADIDPATHNLDPAAVWRMITPRTTGIVGVHLWGRASPVKELEAIASEHNLRLMFDASHGFGCSLDGKLLGGFGECEVFSFHATKFFNTFEGGAVVTNNDTLAEKMRPPSAPSPTASVCRGRRRSQSCCSRCRSRTSSCGAARGCCAWSAW